MESSASRQCPECGLETDERHCPYDQFQTMPLVSKPEPLVGTTLAGRYAIEALLGRGGMGAVYLAKQLPIGRPVAIKVIDARATVAERYRRRFEQEARAIAALTHPNAVKLVDFGVLDDGVQFLVMEYLEGVELGRLIASEAPLAEERVVHIVSQILEVLAEAHDNGIIHRDLKPANIFLAVVAGKTDYVKVLDFGVAKLDRSDPVAATVTLEGTPVGTPKYMSPEQCRATTITASTDLYSLGLIAYEMVAGYAPFDCGSPTAFYVAHSVEAPRPLTRDGAPFTGPMAEFIARCLEKDPAARPASAAEALRMLRGDRDDAAATARRTTSSVVGVAPLGGENAAPEAVLTTRSVVVPRVREGKGPSRAAMGLAAVALVAGGLVIAKLATGGVADERAEAAVEEAAAAPEATPPIASAPVAAETPPAAVATHAEGASGTAVADPPSALGTTPRDARPAEPAPVEVAAVPDPTEPVGAATHGTGVVEEATDGPADETVAPQVRAAVETPPAAVEDAPRELSVTVKVAPETADILANGAKIGTGSAVVTWPAGTKPPRVVAQRAGYVSRGVAVAAKDDGETLAVTLKLRPKPSAPPPVNLQEEIERF